MRKLLILLLTVAAVTTASAQKVAVKTNFLYDALLTANLGVELKLSDVTTLDLVGGWNQWKLNENKQWKHWLAQPEFRLWLCESFNGSFFGLHALGGVYSVSSVKLPFGLVPELANHKYEGHFIGAGISFGYQWVLGNKWNLEASIGAGYARIYYEKFDCIECPPRLANGHENYFGPTKATLSLLYFF